MEQPTPLRMYEDMENAIVSRSVPRPGELYQHYETRTKFEIVGRVDPENSRGDIPPMLVYKRPGGRLRLTTYEDFMGVVFYKDKYVFRYNKIGG